MEEPLIKERPHMEQFKTHLPLVFHCNYWPIYLGTDFIASRYLLFRRHRIDCITHNT